MADITIGNRIGQADGAGDVYANLPEIWEKEIMTVFHQDVLALKLFKKRVISEGKSAKFRVMGEGSAMFHVVGENVFEHNSGEYLSDIKHEVETIFIDRPLVSADVLDLQEVKMSGVSDALRMETTHEIGHALAEQYDKYAFQKLGDAARTTNPLAEKPNGYVVTDADADTNAQSLFESIFDVLQRFDENNVPQDNRYIFIKPAQKWLLFSDPTNNATRYNLDKDLGAEGNFAKGTLGRIAGALVIMSNNLPSTDLSSAITGDKNDYSHNFSTTVCLMGHSSAIGQVILDDVRTFMEVHEPTLSFRVMAHLGMGIGVLRPESAAEIKTA